MTTQTQQTVRIGRRGVIGTLHEIEGYTVALTPNGRVIEPCPRCGDFSGFIPTYAGIFGGECFQCHGGGYVKAHETIAEAEQVLAKRAKAKAAAQRRRQAKWAAQEAQAEAEFAAWTGVNAELTATLTELAERWAPIANGEYGYYDNTDERVDGWLREAAASVRTGQVPKHTEAIPALLAEYLAEREVKAASQYAGEVGEVVTVTGTVTVAMPIDGQWGTSVMLVLTNGPVTLKAYTTARWAWEVEKGDVVTITGTVKAQDVYDGVKQTVLARPKLGTP